MIDSNIFTNDVSNYGSTTVMTVLLYNKSKFISWFDYLIIRRLYYDPYSVNMQLTWIFQQKSQIEIKM